MIDRSIVIGQGSQTIPVAGNEFDAMVGVAVSIDQDFEAAAATRYFCALRIAAGNISPVSWDDCTALGFEPKHNLFICGARGAVIVATIEGQL